MYHIFVGKRVLACLFFAAVLVSCSDSFALSNSSKISIKVKGKCEKSDDSGETELESDENLAVISFQTETETYTLHLELKNGSDQEYKGILQWCFVSDHSSGNIYDEIPEEAVSATFSPGKKSITLAPGAELSETIVSAPFVYEEKTVETEWYIGDGGTSEEDYETGDVYKGYVILFIVNGEILASASNSGRYLKEKWIQRCRQAIAGTQ